MADISFAAGTVGLGIPFVIYDGISLLSDPASATVTWLCNDGTTRRLSLVSALSAEFLWTTGVGEFRVPARQIGQLRVSVGTGTFWTSSFSLHVHPTLARQIGE